MPNGTISTMKLNSQGSIPMKLVADRSGMTLIELLVAGVLSVIIGGVFYVLYSLYSNEVKENNAYFAMQQQYENLSEQIAFDTRVAHKILPEEYTPHDTCDTLYDTIQSVFLYSIALECMGGYRIEGDVFEEYETTREQWIPFEAGNGIVRVDPARSWFVLPGCKNEISLHLTLAFTAHDTTFYLLPRRDQFVCRN